MDQQWEQLRQRCLACRACSLAQERTQVVFGVGDPAAEVLLVGEAPGANEDKQGEPFVGRAGKLLDDMLQMIGLSRERIYITNSVKCRPPQNRDPLNTEKEGVQRLSAAANGADAAENSGVSGAHQRHGAHQGRFPHHAGARPVFPAGRHRENGHVPPGGPAAGPRQEAGDLRGSQAPAGQDP